MFEPQFMKIHQTFVISLIVADTANFTGEQFDFMSRKNNSFIDSHKCKSLIAKEQLTLNCAHITAETM